MAEVPPRCPFCANVLKMQPTFWERIGLKASKVSCPTCQRTSDARDANTMGAAYFQWAELYRGQLTSALESLPLLPEPAMHRAMGNPHKDDMQLMTSREELVRSILRYQRVAIVEKAKGREASVDIVTMCNETTGAPEVVAVLGTSSAESGAKEWEQLVGRNGHSSYVLYTHPATAAAEPRVRRAVHEHGGSHRSGAPIIGVTAQARPATPAQQAR